MNIANTISALSLAFAMIGGAVMIAPAPAHAANSGFISFGALKKDQVPCSKRGASAQNCRPGKQANPHTRGCSAITRCRG
jgi:hypothetical protein